MNKRTINLLCVIALTCAGFLSVASPVIAEYGTGAAMESGSLKNKLSEIDAFHPPTRGYPGVLMYKEWHYFNILDDEQNLSFITTLTLNGNVSDPGMSAAVVLMSYFTLVKENLTADVYPVTLAEWSDMTPDMRIAGSSVRLTKEGYHLHVVSADTRSVFDAIFKPEAEHAPVFSVPLGEGRIINWLSASPKMKVNGKFTVNRGTAEEKTYTFKNVRGYHDHNWGYWLWQDDMGWDWGQATQVKGGDETGTYAFSFGNITNMNHTGSKSTVLEFWKNKKIIAGFKDNEIQIRHEIMNTVPILPDAPFPLVTVLNANSGENKLNMVFTTEHMTPIPIGLEGGGYRIIWELTGVYEVSGYVNGKPVSYITTGYLEYVA
ncbi:MAG: hypothetical protein O8C56_00950 [Candidatus Methanoperedens sp.]|nr:hypothetical protein [Candidatus Methanoperedens sp.]